MALTLVPDSMSSIRIHVPTLAITYTLKFVFDGLLRFTDTVDTYVLSFNSQLWNMTHNPMTYAVVLVVLKTVEVKVTLKVNVGVTVVDTVCVISIQVQILAISMSYSE